VTIDKTGNIYFTGSSEGDLDGEINAGDRDIFLAKYDGSGNKLWVKLLGTASREGGLSVTNDTFGNIYLTGYTEGDLGGEINAGGRDIFIAKYDDSGNKLWVKLLGTSSPDYGVGVVTNTSGDIYLTGDSDSDPDGEYNVEDRDIFLAKYDGSGENLWVKNLGSESEDYSDGLAIDESGNIYITGATGGDLGGEALGVPYDAFLVKYNFEQSDTFPWEIFYPAFIKKK
jgi:hypothetical protein